MLVVVAVGRVHTGRVVEGGGVVVEGVGGREARGVRGHHGLVEQVLRAEPDAAGSAVAEACSGRGVGVAGGREQVCLLTYRHHVHTLLPLLGHLQVVHDLCRRRTGVVGQVLGQQLAEQLLQVGVDGEGPLASLATAGLVDVVGEEEVERLNQLGQVEAAPVMELDRKEVN